MVRTKSQTKVARDFGVSKKDVQKAFEEARKLIPIPE